MLELAGPAALKANGAMAAPQVAPKPLPPTGHTVTQADKGESFFFLHVSYSDLPSQVSYARIPIVSRLEHDICINLIQTSSTQIMNWISRSGLLTFCFFRLRDTCYLKFPSAKCSSTHSQQALQNLGISNPDLGVLAGGGCQRLILKLHKFSPPQIHMFMCTMFHQKCAIWQTDEELAMQPRHWGSAQCWALQRLSHLSLRGSLPRLFKPPWPGLQHTTLRHPSHPATLQIGVRF